MRLIKKYALSTCIIVSFSISLPAQTTIELIASRDVSLGYHDNYNSANRNYGNAQQNAAYYIPGFIGGINSNRALIDFDLSSVPSGAVILKATLNLYAFKNYPAETMVSNGHFGNNTSYFKRVTSNWDEYEATWNMQPQTTTENQVVLHQSIDANEDYIDIDITDLVIDMVNKPDESFGFLLGLMQESEYANLSFYSKEGTDSSKYPVLKITFQLEEEIIPDPIEPPSDIIDEENIGTIPPIPEIPVDPGDFDFIIYPNPGRKLLKIEFNNRDRKRILIYTMEGKIIFSTDSEELIYELGVRDLAPAVYFIRCSNEQKTITKKYVKMAR